MLAWGLAQLGGSLALLLQPALPHPGIFLLTFPIALAAMSRPRSRWLAACWLGGALAAWHADAALGDRLDHALEGQVVEITGRIDGLIESDGRRQRFLFAVESASWNGAPVKLPQRVRLNLYEPLAIASGERWRWRVKLRRARGLANPGTFDYERWLFAERIGATGYVRDVARAQRLAAGQWQWRAAVAKQVAANVDGEAAGLLRGLATADRGGISDAQWELLRVTGTAHLMAISGLHIALVAALGVGLVAWLRRRVVPRASPAWPPLAGFTLAFAYGALAGFGLPVRRALAGAAVVLGALAARRVIVPGHAYGLALTLVLCLDPLAPLNVGFWLSFGAVAAIVYLVAGRRPRRAGWRQALWVQCGLFLLLAPMTLASFGQLPLVSTPANLVAIPLFGVAIVPLVLLAMLLLPWPSLAKAVFAVAGWLLERLLDYLALLAAIDPGLAPAVPSPLAWLLAVAAVVLLAAPRALPGRRLAPLLLLPAAWPSLVDDASAPPLALHFLDVGQGLAVIVETPSRTLVYDAGPALADTDAAELVVVPFLRSRGRAPDLVLITHSDTDHAGGMETLRRHFPAAVFAGRSGRGEQDCAGMSWRWDDVHFDVLHPPVTLAGDDNDASCVLRVVHDEWRVLLTGDIEAAGEARLLRDHAAELRADIVLVPHHGSMTSSGTAFVQAVRPRLAIAAAGFGNRWRFPREEVVARWRAAGADVQSTGEAGAITLVFVDGQMRVERFRDRQRLWREPAPSGQGR